MLKLSVVIPAYNTPKTLLEHCLLSLQENLSEVKEDVEILLINDGSTESHVEMLFKEASKDDARLKYICKKNSGVSTTRNLGIQIASGEYVTFVDSDDFLKPHALKYILDIIDEHSPEMAIFGLHNEFIKTKPLESVKYMLSQSDIAVIMKAMCSCDEKMYWEKGFFFGYAVAKIFRTSFIRQHKLLYNPQLAIGEDCVFNLSCLSCAKEVYVDNTCVYHYVFNSGSAMRKPSSAYMNNLPFLLKLLEDNTHHELLSHEEIGRAIRRRCLACLRVARNIYLTHPKNDKSFWELKSELKALLSETTIHKYTHSLRFSDAHNKQELKNIILLKLHLYWIFLITERRKRKKRSS